MQPNLFFAVDDGDMQFCNTWRTKSAIPLNQAFITLQLLNTIVVTRLVVYCLALKYMNQKLLDCFYPPWKVPFLPLKLIMLTQWLQYDTPNVVQLMGICNKGTPFIMMEYMRNGDLNIVIYL